MCECQRKGERKKGTYFWYIFSYLPLDYAYFCETEPEDSDYFGIKRKVKQHYAIFRKRFVEKSVYVACGVMIFYMLQIAGREVYDICTGE